MWEGVCHEKVYAVGDRSDCMHGRPATGGGIRKVLRIFAAKSTARHGRVFGTIVGVLPPDWASEVQKACVQRQQAESGAVQGRVQKQERKVYHREVLLVVGSAKRRHRQEDDLFALPVVQAQDLTGVGWGVGMLQCYKKSVTKKSFGKKVEKKMSHKIKKFF